MKHNMRMFMSLLCFFLCGLEISYAGKTFGHRGQRYTQVQLRNRAVWQKAQEMVKKGMSHKSMFNPASVRFYLDNYSNGFQRWETLIPRHQQEVLNKVVGLWGMFALASLEVLGDLFDWDAIRHRCRELASNTSTLAIERELNKTSYTPGKKPSLYPPAASVGDIEFIEYLFQVLQERNGSKNEPFEADNFSDSSESDDRP